MTTKVKIKVERPTTDLMLLSDLTEGDWFITCPIGITKPSTIGVIVDGKPFYPWWYGKSWRIENLNQSRVRRIDKLVIREGCERFTT